MRVIRTRTRGWRTAAAVIAAGALVGGCATIPTSGPIQIGEPVAAGSDAGGIRPVVRAPEPGATQQEIVQGFVQANAASDDDYAVARAYLSPEVRESWNPASGATVFDDGPGYALTLRGTSTVRLEATEIGRIDAQASYQPSRAGSRVDDQFVLRQVDGEWRIIGVRDGLLLTRRDVQRVFNTYSVYFVDPSGAVVVPDPVVLAGDRPSLATTLVRRLLAGPSEWLAPAVVSAVPEGTQLAIDAIPIVDNVVTVDLTEQALLADDDARTRMAAQLTWTLTALPGVAAVRLAVNGQALIVPGAGEILVRDSFGAFDPDGAPAGRSAYAVVGGAFSLIGDESTPVPGAFGDGSVTPRVAAVALSEDRLAAESDAAVVEGSVFESQFQPDSPPTLLARVSEVGSLSYDRFGLLYVTDSATGAIRILPGSEGPFLSGIGATGVAQRARISRDGTRVAVALADPASGEAVLVVGTLNRLGSGVRIEGLRRVEAELSDVRDLAWADADTIVVLARGERASIQAFSVPVGGTAVEPLGGVPGLSAIAAYPGSPLIAQADGGLWQNSGAGWVRVSGGGVPVYPG